GSAAGFLQGTGCSGDQAEACDGALGMAPVRGAGGSGWARILACPSQGISRPGHLEHSNIGGRVAARQGRGDPFASGGEHGNVLVPLERVTRGNDDAGPPDEAARVQPPASRDGKQVRRILHDDSGQVPGKDGERIFGGLFGHRGLQFCRPPYVTGRMAILLAEWPGRKKSISARPGGDARFLRRYYSRMISTTRRVPGSTSTT